MDSKHAAPCENDELSTSECLNASVVIADVAAVAVDFEKLCCDFACPEHARVYGTDFHRDEVALALRGDDLENCSSAPKKGSLRVFAQQVRVIVIAQLGPGLGQ
jgi:hypothetical protein